MLDTSTILFIALGLIAGIVCGMGVLIVIALKKTKPIDDQPYKTTFSFSGNLRQTPLLDAIQFLEIGRRDGLLHIYSGRRKGYLTFVKGQVVDAFYRNVTKREAVFEMLDLQDGDFYFEPKQISQPKLIADSFMDIAFEWDARKNNGEEAQDPAN